MYELKTLLPQFDIQLPTCMYTLNPVSLAADSAAAACGSVGATTTDNVTTFHATTTNSSSANNNNTTTTATLNAPAPVKCVLDLDVLAEQIKQQQIKATASEVGVIVQRQERVLKQLNELKEQLARIRKTLNLCGKGPQHTNAPQTQQQVTTKSATTTGNNGGLREEPLHDIVINGHPNFIPYALLALKNAWQDLFTINVKTFTHSTLTEGLSEQAREFENLLKSGPVNSSKPKINVTLIWKNCEHTELISSPTMYVPIYGEVNIIRYLGRVGPTEYRYEDSPLCNEIDAVLDICYRLLRCTTPKAKAALLKELSQRLGSQAYFGGDSMSVADIGVHSSLKRMPSITDKMLTPTLREWRKRAQLVTRI